LKYIYGIHGIEGSHIVNGKGWVVATEELGHDPTNTNGVDYRQIANGATVIARLNNGYEPNGTIPIPSEYPNFAQRVQNFVRESFGCHHWVIGCEPNLSRERPSNQPILPESYAECYSMCKQKIHDVLGHENDIVCMAAVGPWNVETGDWIDYFVRMLSYAEIMGGVGGIAIHTYTHGTDPQLIFSDQTMDPPYNDRYYQFRAYVNFMHAIPETLRDVPVYITETDQNEPWADTNSGWVQNAYMEIDAWNQINVQKIRCLALYRWPSYDQYAINGKQGVIDDFLLAQQNSYTWTDEPVEPPIEPPVEPPIPGGEMTIIFEDGFEGAFYYADDKYSGDTDVSELECPVGWKPDWVQGTEPGINNRPEYKPKIKPQPEVYEGERAVGIHSTFSSHDGVIYRQFDVTPGAKIKASVMAMGKGDGGAGMVVGIDPTGGIDFKNLDPAYWGEWWSTDVPDWVEAAWANISKEVIANAPKITVFLRSNSRFPNNNTGHFDNFVLESDKDDPVDPPVPPTPPGGLVAQIQEIRTDLEDALDKLDVLESTIIDGAIMALPV